MKTPSIHQDNPSDGGNTSWRHYLWLGVVLVSFAATRVSYFDVAPLFDGSIYLSDLLKALDYFKWPWYGWWYFCLGGHPALSCSAYLALGQLADYGNVYWLHFQYLLLAIAGLISFHGLLTLLNPAMEREGEAALGSAMLAANPLFFGCSLDFTLDFPMTVLFLAYLLMLLRGWRKTAAFCGISLVFTKETGFVLYALTAMTYFVAFEWRRISASVGTGGGAIAARSPIPGKMSRWTIAVLKIAFPLAIPGLAFCIYVALVGGRLWQSEESLRFVSNGFNCFALDMVNIKERLTQCLLMNFSWLPLAVLLCAVLYRAYAAVANKDQPAKCQEQSWQSLLVILCAWAGFIVFNCLFVTYRTPRYILPATVMLLALSYYSLGCLCANGRLRIAVLAAVCICSGVQIFRTVDPVSNALYPPIRFGDRTMMRVGPGGAELVYNAEFAQISRVLNKAFRTVSVSEDSALVLYGWWPAHLGRNDYRRFALDQGTRAVTFKTTNSFLPTISVVTDDLASRNPAPSRLFYITQPWHFDEITELRTLRLYYDATRSWVVDINGYSCRVFEIAKQSPRTRHTQIDTAMVPAAKEPVNR